MSIENQVSYNHTNTYNTLNEYTSKTKNVWMVFHGMGYLSRYFIKYFSQLDATENFIVAPQAPSKYYQSSNFKHVGASWLTKENTLIETENVLTYIDQVFKTEKISEVSNLIVLGYSQGVSIATRWLASRKINCEHLVLHSGGIPKELTKEDFKYMPTNTIVTFLYGTNDKYINEARINEEELKGNNLFGERLNIQIFEGVHEVNKEFLLELSK
ncbi:MAG: putative esterase [Ulvibacter sp.]|jgi:predicted esterase|tara:strand:+ start:8036 stop:8677 length:642 start_codon:yes stop_codon:yes gene_type:complete